MRKKAIEKIPFLGLKKVSPRKSVKYIGVTAVKIVSGKKHLFLEVYKNDKARKKVPEVRIVLTKKDFATFFPETGKWSGMLVISEKRRFCPAWYGEEERGYETEGEREKKNVLQSEEDEERIKEYCKLPEWTEKEWWGDKIKRFQDEIAVDKRNRAREQKYQRRQQALKDRMEHTKPLPVKIVAERAEEIHFKGLHFLYYKKSGPLATVACSKCGGVTKARWKDGISYESGFEKRIEEPREGYFGTCPICGEYGQYKCQGKSKKAHVVRRHLFLGQKFKENGMVLRYIQVEKEWRLEIGEGKKGPKMRGASEEIFVTEIARAYIEPGKKTQIDYHKMSLYSGKGFWDDCNLYGVSSIVIKRAPVMRETYEEMKGTAFRYSALEEYEKKIGGNEPITYLERYKEIPQLEMLVKLGLTGVVEELVKRRYGVQVYENFKTPAEFLGIRRERVKLLIRKNGDVFFWKVMQTERRMEGTWTEEQIEHLAEIGIYGEAIERITRYMGIQKFLNRVKGYAGCEYGTECSRAAGRLQRIAMEYVDYLNMREDLGYDLNNSVYQKPRDLRKAHDKMTAEQNKKIAGERIKEAERKYRDIRRNYRKLRERYLFEDDKYLIRPARSAEEIIIEGRTLHHCVGGDGYLRKHNNGVAYILMLRKKSEPENPYITVEIRAGTGRIVQWYGQGDKKQNEREIEEWLKGYIKKLECRDEGMRTNIA